MEFRSQKSNFGQALGWLALYITILVRTGRDVLQPCRCLNCLQDIVLITTQGADCIDQGENIQEEG